MARGGQISSRATEELATVAANPRASPTSKRPTTFRGNLAPLPDGQPEASSAHRLGRSQGPRALTVAWGDGHRSEFHYQSGFGTAVTARCAATAATASAHHGPHGAEGHRARRGPPDGRRLTWRSSGRRRPCLDVYGGSGCGPIATPIVSGRSAAAASGRRPGRPTSQRLSDGRLWGGKPEPKATRGLLKMYELLRDYGIVMVSPGSAAIPRADGALWRTRRTDPRDDRLRPHLRCAGRARLQARRQDRHAPGSPHDDAFYYSPPGIDVFHCLLNTAEASAANRPTSTASRSPRPFAADDARSLTNC